MRGRRMNASAWRQSAAGATPPRGPAGLGTNGANHGEHAEERAAERRAAGTARRSTKAWDRSGAEDPPARREAVSRSSAKSHQA